MISPVRLLSCAAALLGAVTLHAQNTVFNAAFTSDTLSSSTTPVPTYPTPTATSTGWAVLSNKAAPYPTESGGALTINMASTSSGFVEAQALFAAAPIQLLPGTYLELTFTFVPTYVLTNASDNLMVGFFNSGGSAPLFNLLTSGLTSGSSTSGTGGAKGWKGFQGNIPISGTPRMLNRPAQTATTNIVQDTVVDGQSSSVGYANGASASGLVNAFTTLTNGNTYTMDYRLALSADGTTFTATTSLYNGTGITNVGANTRIVTYSGTFSGTAVLTQAFDALAIGWRADASQLSNLKLTALKVQTTGGAPWLTTQPPASIAVSIGSDLNLNTVAGGAVSSSQWQVSTDSGSTWTDISSTTNASAATGSLTLTYAQYTDAGRYRLKLTNAAGTSYSNATTVTVSATPVAPTISIDPVSSTVLGGTSTTFSATVNGTSPLSYQWQYSTDGTTYTPITGATAATYTIPSVQLSNEGYYTLTVTNVAGTVTSGAAFLTVNQPLAINTQPAGATLNVGDTYTLSVGAVGRPAPAYQWSLNGSALSGATNASYVITSAAAANAGLYTVSVTNSAGDLVASNGAGIAVLSPTLTATAATPGVGSTGLDPDTRLSVTFSQAVSVGVIGTIQIFDATNPTTPVDTIDLVAATAAMKTLRAASTTSTQALPVQTKTIGGVTNFNYYPITVSGNTATIYPRNGVLTYGHSYYVTVDPGVFVDSTGLSYAGSSGTTWNFAVKASGPISGATRVVIAPDGSGDFCTVQGALDWVPTSNATPITLFLKNGTYFEQVYFTGKNSLTFLGESRAGAVIAYPNNNNFNNASGVYHRMVFNGDHVNNVALVNLTIQNTTPKGGSQAEALILNGGTTSKAVITNVDLFSYQDTLQINGQAYLANSHITGDVDFMWGNGPCFFDTCQLTQVTGGGYFTQIRNGSSNHGFVFSNCRFNASAGVTNSYLGRIDPAGYPVSEVVLLDSTVGDATNNAFLSTTTGVSGTNYQAGWWLLNNAASATPAATVRYWANNLLNGSGAALTNPNGDSFTAMPTDATTQANYRNASWVLNTKLDGTSFGSWTPQLAPLVATQPVGQSVGAGAGITLSVQGFGVPAVAYQWQRNGVAITGATNATYTVSSAAGSDAGTYAVVLTNAGGTTTSSVVPVTVSGAAPVITLQPANTSALLGTTATLNVWAVGDTPFTYQWSKDGTPLTGATNQSLRLTALQAAQAGSYTVAVTNAGGTTTSTAATLSLAAPATTLPTQPVIPAASFNAVAYGAVGDGATDNAAALQAAFNAASAAGGGTVELPPASAPYLSGPISIPANIDFQVDGGATLKALPFGRYPNSTTAPAHFITVVKNASNVEFSGSGTIDGGGADWWNAYDNNLIANRPRLVQFTGLSNALISGITLLNSPSFNLAFSGTNTNVTISNVTISAPGDSPNTDGMDLAGTNFLVQGCSVSVGDDNIVAKPGSAFCRNLYIANCTIGQGHGVSVGGQTNVGLDGMTVTNCTFNGTSSALRLKADPTQGGPVTNITYSNLTMTNVQYPILFYSYYNQLGSPGATSGSSQTTPAKVNTWNGAPPNSLASTTLPTWSNITLTNITITNASGYCTIWGIPLASGFVSNVTFNNVSISGGSGLELYDATGIQFTGTNSVGPIVTCNALAITTQPQSQAVSVGDTVTFTAAALGGSGVNGTAPTYQWMLNGSPLTDGAQSDGSSIAGSTTTTLTVTNVRKAKTGSYTFVASANLDGFSVATNALAKDSVPVSATSSAATLTATPLPATVSLSGLSLTYTGVSKTPVATTTPAGLPVAYTFNGSSNVPVAAGTYTVVGTITDPNYVGSATGTFTIGQSSASSISVSNLNAVYDGGPHGATVASDPQGIPLTVKYNDGTVLPVAAGSYTVTVTFADLNYSGSVTATLVIAKANQTFTFPTVGSTDVNTAVTLPATTSAGLPISYSIVSGSATVSGNTVMGIAAGSVTVRGTQAGNANYNAVTADLTFPVVSRGTQTITFAPIPSHLTNDPAISLSVSASSGLPVTLTVVSGPAILGGITLTLTGAPGTVTVRATQPGNASFLPAAAVDQTFSVGDAATDTFFGDLVPLSTAEATVSGVRVEAATAKAGDVAAAIVTGTGQGTVLIVAPAVNLDVSLPVAIASDGTYSVAFTNHGQALTLVGSLANGMFSGRIAALAVSFSTPVQIRSGPTSALVGYYSAAALNTAQGATYSIVGPNGQALVLAVTSTTTVGGLAQVTATGAFTLTPTDGVTISGSVDPVSAGVSETVVTATGTISFAGLKNQVLRTDRLVNLSSRGLVSGGERVLISGFVIGGSQPKQVMIRAVGPTLAAFGVKGVLANPHLQLLQNGQVIADNAGWSTAANAADIAAAGTRLGAFQLPANSADAALLLTLPPGAYTAQISSATQSGVAMLEIYDGSTNPQGEYQRLANISTRGDAGSGDNTLIGGFVVTGNSPKKLLIRGIGPTLTAFQVSAALSDPKLRVYQGTTLIDENDNWGAGDGSVASDVVAASRATGAFPLAAGSKDSALVVTLAPGSYTAQVSGVANATGVALIEVYEVP